MSWRSIFNIRLAPPRKPSIPGEPLAAGDASPSQAGSFVTPQSLATFSGMTAAITVVWVFVEGVGGFGHRLWIGAVIAACCGAALYWTDASDPNRSPDNPAPPMRILAAVVNTVLLFNAASGSYDLGTRALQQNAAAAAPAGSVVPAPLAPR